MAFNQLLMTLTGLDIGKCFFSTPYYMFGIALYCVLFLFHRGHLKRCTWSQSRLTHNSTATTSTNTQQYSDDIDWHTAVQRRHRLTHSSTATTSTDTQQYSDDIDWHTAVQRRHRLTHSSTATTSTNTQQYSDDMDWHTTVQRRHRLTHNSTSTTSTDTQQYSDDIDWIGIGNNSMKHQELLLYIQ